MQAETTRKLIDIKAPVFNCLALKAKRKGVSLKRYIEDLLEEDAYEEHRAAPAGVTDGKILSLIGLAKPVIRPSDLEDDRLQYILNK
jgi:hypothetical protein